MTPSKPAQERLIDRETELRELRALLETPGPSPILLYGRRRVGKTFLLNRSWPSQSTFYFVAADATPEINRREIVEEVSRQTGVDHAPEDYPTWRSVFRLLLDLGGEKPVAVILDEYQYLRGGEEDVDSQLLAALETFRATGGSRRPFVLALCGSLVAEMEEIKSSGSPLYGRFRWIGQLAPFDYLDAARMAGFPDRRAAIACYGAFGGTPSFLDLLVSEESVEDNIARLALARRGEVRLMVESALEQEQGLRSVTEYRSILLALGRGLVTRNQIAQGTGLAPGFDLQRRLDLLEALGYVNRARNFDAARNEAFRYRLSDPALQFHYRFVSRYRMELETGSPREVWDKHIAPSFDAYLGKWIFEAVVPQAYSRLREGGKLPLVSEWGTWEGTDRHKESLEMDLVARLTDGGMLTGSVKWGRDPVGLAVHTRHLTDLERLRQSGKKWAYEAADSGSYLLYVSAAGFEKGFREVAEAAGLPVVLWSLEDILPGKEYQTE